MRLIEDGFLNVPDNVAIFAHHFGQSDLPQLGQLGFAESDRSVAALVPKSVALLQLLELNADDAGESGPHQSPLQRGFAQSAGEQIDVLDAVVHLSQSLDHVEADFFAQVLEGRGPVQFTSHAIFVVGPQSVIAASLDVESGQIEAGERNSLLFEQVIGDFAGDELILILHRSGDQSTHHLKLSSIKVLQCSPLKRPSVKRPSRLIGHFCQIPIAQFTSNLPG